MATAAAAMTVSPPRKQKPRTRASRSNSLQRMLDLEKQSMMDRQNTYASDPATTAQLEPNTSSQERSRDHYTPDTMTTTYTGYSQLLSHMKQQSRTTIPRRQLPADSPVHAVPKNHSHQASYIKSSAGEKGSASMQGRQRKTEQPAYELPTIKPDAGPNTLAALVFGVPQEPAASPTPRPKSSKANRTSKASEGLGVRFADLPHPESETVNQKAAVPDSQDSTLAERRSICQSPSWEAYDRHKKEKKEKALADKEASKEAKARKRRLSKQPPSSEQNPASPTSPPRKTGNYYPPQSHKGLAQSKTEACKSDPALTRPRRCEERPASVVGLSTPELSMNTDIPTPQAPRARSRSSSFSSLFKAPFEARRSSVDHSSDGGFIGGIKLEQHRLAAHQQALNDQALEPDSDIHPALRQTEKRSASPLRFFTPRSEVKDAQSRLYPPIAIRTTGRNQALLGPESPDMREGFVQRWRGRLRPSGQKSTGCPQQKDEPQNNPAQTQPKLPAGKREHALKRISMGKNMSTPAISAPFMIHKMSEPIDDEKLGLETSTKVDHAAHPALSPKPAITTTTRTADIPTVDLTEAASQSGSEVSSPSFETAPSSPPPPPRRSSKRKSLIGLGDAAFASPGGSPLVESRSLEQNGTTEDEARPPRTTPRLDTTVSSPVVVPQRRNVDSEARSPRPLSNRWSISDPPSIPYDSVTDASTNGAAASPKRGLKQAAMSAFGRHGLAPPSMPAAASERPRRSISPNRSSYPRAGDSHLLSTTDIHKSPKVGSKSMNNLGTTDWSNKHTTPTSDANHSSEESCSDGFRTSSSMGTPDTSRPQSERGVFPTFDNEKARHHSGYTSVLPSPAFSFVDDTRSGGPPSPLHLDPIQAAALKVKQAFPNVPDGRPDYDRRGSSDYERLQPKQPTHLKERDRPTSITSISELATEVESRPATERDPAAGPWPATYLQAARRAAPSAPSPSAASKPHSPSLRPQAAPRVTSAHSKFLSTNTSQGDSEGIAKMFVECCGCKYFHDMPSKLYEVMAHPEGAVPLSDSQEFSGSVSMTVKCPWCKHEMSTRCCAGLAAMVYVKERLH